MIRKLTAGVLASLLCQAPAASAAVQVSLAVTGAVNFTDASPDLASEIGPQNVSVQLRFTGRPRDVWTLTVLANSNLEAGPREISASQVRWAATPTPTFIPGNLSTIAPVLCGSGRANRSYTGQFSFYLRNSWSYAPGNYSSTATFTLSSP